MNVTGDECPESPRPQAAAVVRSLETRPSGVRVGLWLVIGGITLLGLFVLRSDHDWGGDFAQYILHAATIAEGRPYTEIGLIYNPHNVVLSPRAYPPGFPLLLAPVWAACGANLLVIKIVQLLLLCASLFVLTRLFSDLPVRQLQILLVLIGLNPLMLDSLNAIESEHLFVPLWLLTILCASIAVRHPHAGLLPGVGVGMLMLCVVQTRTVGIVLLPALVVVELWKYRHVRAFLVGAVVAFGLLACLQKLTMPSTGSGYLTQLERITPATLLSNARENLAAVGQVFRNGVFAPLRFVLFALGLAAGAVGCAVSLRRQPLMSSPATSSARGAEVAATEPQEFLFVTSVMYALLIVIWPTAAGPRMVLPLIPAFLYYVLQGVRWLGDRLSRNLMRPFAWLMFASFTSFYLNVDAAPVSGPMTEPARELFAAIQRTTSSDDVFLFFKPRVLTVFADRPASVFPEPQSEVDWHAWGTEIGADYVVVRQPQLTQRLSFLGEPPDPQVDGTPVFENSDFRMYRFPAKSVATSGTQ